MRPATRSRRGRRSCSSCAGGAGAPSLEGHLESELPRAWHRREDGGARRGGRVCRCSEVKRVLDALVRGRAERVSVPWRRMTADAERAAARPRRARCGAARHGRRVGGAYAREARRGKPRCAGRLKQAAQIKLAVGDDVVLEPDGAGRHLGDRRDPAAALAARAARAGRRARRARRRRQRRSGHRRVRRREARAALAHARPVSRDRRGERPGCRSVVINKVELVDRRRRARASRTTRVPAIRVHFTSVRTGVGLRELHECSGRPDLGAHAVRPASASRRCSTRCIRVSICASARSANR